MIQITNYSVCTILSGNLTNPVSTSESLNDLITVVYSWKGRLSVNNDANFSQYITQIYHMTSKDLKLAIASLLEAEKLQSRFYKLGKECTGIFGVG